MSRLVALLTAVLLGASLVACSPNKSDASAGKPAAPALLLAPEDVVRVESALHAGGPVLTGSLQPERRADLRAEVSATVLQVLRDNGDVVRRGDLLVRMDDTSIRDALSSAQEAARAAERSVDQSERQFKRLITLQGQGMSSTQSVEDAEARRNQALSDLAAAKARVVAARQQLQRTEVRAPFDGVVSDRKVSAGDTAQIGKELLKVIDPASMRFEGLVSVERVAEIKPGQVVHFRVSGAERAAFSGRVQHIAPSADEVTRQVSVRVAVEGDVPRVAGLYAEGQVVTSGQAVPMLREASLTRAGDKVYAWRVAGNTLQKAELALGDRDARSGLWVVRSGVASGDEVLRAPGSSLVDGQAVSRVAAKASK
ncbi:efflux RND transporter periplasmic adaptor subunit [Niveibacterium sp. 24ML]|uniref:efflux RND transporter periplasmic adaptor subunit n=1 Tax=Niveibacterium sp. 24ML TaxID=2985512 RepID=UPI00226EC107|nr:efflux RND transporter periplasmic adaptor subunit [Niveibacterium sp. 24ML]MCX9158524.1 efflux RND transporter periplasmic adaptor subunit [Niveibacterium sp. 24ML]